MDREELIYQSERGRAVGEFLASPYIAGIYQDTMGALRSTVNRLDPHEQVQFTIAQASAQALERFWVGLQALVEIGAEAESDLASDEEVKGENDHRGIL